MLRSVLAIFMMLAGLFLLGACEEEQGSFGGGGEGEGSRQEHRPRQTVHNMPISGGIGDAVTAGPSTTPSG